MDLMTQLLGEKTALLGKIAEAAQRGDSRDVLARGEKLGKLESLIRRYENLLHDISSLDAEDIAARLIPKLSENRVAENGRECNSLKSASGKSTGKAIRSAFLKGLSVEDIHLRQVKGTIYETRTGKRIGIAVATERRPDRWFLGLPAGGFDRAILLCMRETGDIVEFWLPESFFEDYGNRMSQSGGQMKFNIVLKGDGYVVLVPGTNGVNASTFRKDYALLG